jgi:transcriptional antiterminator NusG
LLERVPGLLKVLKDNYGPFEIPEEEIAVIKKLICNGEVIEQSRVFAESDKITIADGPLLGLEGLIISIDKRKGRAKVRLSFAGEPRLVDLSIDIIQPA